MPLHGCGAACGPSGIVQSSTCQLETYAGCSSCRGGELGGAVLAPGGGDGQIGCLAFRAALGGFRLAEHGRPAPLHVGPVGHHEHEVDDGQENNEIDDRTDECAQVDPLPVDGPAETLPGRAATDCVDQRRDDVVDEGLDQCGEGKGDHQPDGDD